MVPDDYFLARKQKMFKKILSILLVGLLIAPVFTMNVNAHVVDVDEVAKLNDDHIPEGTRLAISFIWDGKDLPVRYPGVYGKVGDTEVFIKDGKVSLDFLDKYEVTYPSVFRGKTSCGVEYWVNFKNPEEVEKFKKELAIFNQMNIMDRSGFYSTVYTNEAFQEEYVKLVNEFREKKGLEPLNAKMKMGHMTLETIKAFEKGETKPVYKYGIGKYRGYAKQMLNREDIYKIFEIRDESTAKLMAHLVFSELQEKGGLKSWEDPRFTSTWLNIKKTNNGIMFVEIFDDTTK